MLTPPRPTGRLRALVPLLWLASCAAAGRGAVPSVAYGGPDAGWPPQESSSTRRDSRGTWPTGAALMQGYIGVSSFEHVGVDGKGSRVDGDDGDLDHLPLIGGGGQWKLGGDRVALGLEGMLGLSGRADAEAFAIGGGGAVVAVDVDLLLVEFYGGPFASIDLGRRLRLYGAAGPLLQFADYDQSGAGLSDDGSGFGTGWYARAGFEFALPSRTLIGLGVRWSDSEVDLGGDLGDLEIEGIQTMLTVSHGF